jgi:hypothetical protein
VLQQGQLAEPLKQMFGLEKKVLEYATLTAVAKVII